MIAFFGTGLLGSGFVRAMRQRNETVHVWNRTRAKASALAADGAIVFDDTASAAKGATSVHLSLSDDQAVDEVLAQALPGLGGDAIVVDHTTTSPAGTKERAIRWNEGGRTFVHAPVFMGPQNALESTGMMLVSGDPARVARVRPVITPMTGKVIELGEAPETAAAFKLFGNLFLMFFTGGLAEVFQLARATGVEPRAAASLFEHFNPGLTIGGRIDRMLDGDLSKPSWELGMARKDARLMLEAASAAGAPLTMLPAIAARMDELIASGYGTSDWTILGRASHGRPSQV